MKQIDRQCDKIGIVGDLHIGEVLYNNGVLTAYHNKKRDEFFDSMISKFKEEGVTTILFAGDIFHSRAMVGVADIHFVLDLFANRMKEFDIITIVGNHDMLYENDDSIHVLEMLHYVPNVTVVEEPTLFKFCNNTDWYLFPWLGTDDSKAHAMDIMKFVGKNKKDADRNVFFGHFDIMGIDMGANNLSKNGFEPNEITKYCRYVISGHYHCKSIKKIGLSKIMYLGSPYQLSFAHVGNVPGYYICNSSLKITFVENTISERFVDVKDCDNMDELPDLSNCAVRYATDNTRTADEALDIRLKFEAKNPLYVKEAPYGNISVDNEDLVTIPVDTDEAERVTRMTQIEVAEHFIDNSSQPLPVLNGGGDAKKAIMKMIQEYDAT